MGTHATTGRCNGILRPELVEHSMNKDTVLSLSPSQDALRSREATLRNAGLKVISVMSAVQARFEIEMGRCGVFLICYRVSSQQADELTKLFRRYCPDGRIVFVTKQAQKGEVPSETDFAIPESGGPEQILHLLQQTGTCSSSKNAA
jgi:hypothetical protein